jgi:hypothetical protein
MRPPGTAVGRIWIIRVLDATIFVGATVIPGCRARGADRRRANRKIVGGRSSWRLGANFCARRSSPTSRNSMRMRIGCRVIRAIPCAIRSIAGGFSDGIQKNF